MNVNKGFTLIELLVVVAIIGVLSTIVITNLSNPREAAANAAVKSNLLTIRNQAEVYYNENNSYGPEVSAATQCDGLASAMFQLDTGIKSALASALSASSGSASSQVCAALDATSNGEADNWAVASPLRTPSELWCVDSTGYSGDVVFATPIVSGACNHL